MQIDITIPESLKDITLSQYIKMMEVIENNPENDLLCKQKAVQIICGVPLKQVTKLPKKAFNEISNQILAVLDTKPEHTLRFTLNGVEYGFIPDLDRMSLGEFVDADSSVGDLKKLTQLASVLYRPVIDTNRKGQYLIKPYNGEINTDLEEMPLEYMLGAMVFFWHLSIDLLSYTKKSLLSELTKARTNKEVQALMEGLERNGDGMSVLTSSVEETIRGTMKLHALTFILPYYTYPF